MSTDNEHIEIDLLTRVLSGEASREEQEYVMQWKTASPENEKLYNDFHDVWSALGKTSSRHDIDIDAEWNRHIDVYNPHVQPKAKTISLKTVFSIAASILIIVGFSYAGWLFMSQKAIETNIAETNEILLPDGSRVTINAGSKLKYPKSFSKDSRVVSLEGEAFFEVQKNPQAPFIIKVGDAEVKVLGTSFNVRAYEDMDKIEVTVADGKVSLYGKDQESEKVIVTKGEKAVYDKQLKAVQKQQNNDRNFISWKTHSIQFENDSLSVITKTLQNVYHKEIVLQNPKLNHCTVTTSFENKDLSYVLKILQSTLDITLDEKNNTIYISGKGCE